jgi:hypothetical protein
MRWNDFCLAIGVLAIALFTSNNLCAQSLNTFCDLNGATTTGTSTADCTPFINVNNGTIITEGGQAHAGYGVLGVEANGSVDGTIVGATTQATTKLRSRIHSLSHHQRPLQASW